MPYPRRNSDAPLPANRPLAPMLPGLENANSARETKKFFTKPEKSPGPAANPHRISKRLSKNPEILGFDIRNSRVRWPFSRVRWAQNAPHEPDRTRPNSTSAGQKFSRIQGARRHAGGPYGSFEVIALIEAHPYRSLTGFLWRGMQFARSLQHAIDVIAEILAVINRFDSIPLAEGMEFSSIEQRSRVLAGCDEGIEAPLVADDADLEQHAIVRPVHLKVEEPLLRVSAFVGPEDDFPGERFRAGERMGVEEQGVVDSVEFDGLAGGCFDHFGVAEHGDFMAADTCQVVELPGFGSQHRKKRRQDDEHVASGYINVLR